MAGIRRELRAAESILKMGEAGTCGNAKRKCSQRERLTVGEEDKGTSLRC